MELAVAERFFGFDAALGGEAAVVIDFPVVGTLPGIEILAVEEDDGVGRSPVVFAGRDNGGLRPDDAADVALGNYTRHDESDEYGNEEGSPEHRKWSFRV